MNKQTTLAMPELDLDSPQIKRHRKRRALKDQLAKSSIGIGGMSVIVAISLIFFYLLYEVMPLFGSADITRAGTFAVPQADAGETRWLALEEQAEIGMRIADSGAVIFFRLSDGEVLVNQPLALPEGARVTAVGQADPASRVLVVGLDNGQAMIIKHNYKYTYPNDQRVINPIVEYPVGEAWIDIAPGQSLRSLSLRETDSALLVTAITEENALAAAYFAKEENFITEEVTLERESMTLPSVSGQLRKVLLDPTLNWLFVLKGKNQLTVVDLGDKDAPEIHSTLKLSDVDSRVTEVAFLLGGVSLLVGDDAGHLSQWFMVRDDKNQYSLTKIRQFEHDAGTVGVIVSEERRKGFFVLGEDGHLGAYYATANRRLLEARIVESSIVGAAVAPRGDKMLLQQADGQLLVLDVDNEHPEVSWSTLWGEVWYEGYQEPDYIWQSSAASNDFEPKFSLAPLAFGTLKAAFYAMLIATPLAICGALYTAYFMAPALRRKVKPAIELMEALPTVILGFLAGLFFAPFMEANLPGVFTVLIVVPVAILLFSFAWANLPDRMRLWLPEGYTPMILVPVVLVAGWFSFAISPGVELLLFGGDMRSWLTNDLGINFDQRNALVVGAAMGFAVIPSIFSITEDAIFSVPKSLSHGSLALGATPWQTMVRVILPAASPGIFSAVMIGMGRAVGETMIVLMATGNTPIMDANIFEGMRTLSANIAVEMPESEVGSSHYRILFLAAFVLFIFTFVVNTTAEYIRQRLRQKYSVI